MHPLASPCTMGALTLALAACAGQARPPTRAPAPAPDPRASTSADEVAPPAASEIEDGPPLTREEIRVVVRAKMADVRRCFDAGLARSPELGGRISLRLTIGADGRARELGVIEDELGDAGVVDCLTEAIARWQFPLPRGGHELTIAYPFVFSSERSLRAAGLPRVEGTVKPKAVGAVFEARHGEIASCVDEGQKGTIGLAFTIDDAGAVTRISTYANTLGDHARGCVISAVSSWLFPPAAPGDEARVNHDLWW